MKTSIKPEGDSDLPYRHRRREAPTALDSIEDAPFQTTYKVAEIFNDFPKRIFDQDPASKSRPLGGLPSPGLLMNAVMHDDFLHCTCST